MVASEVQIGTRVVPLRKSEGSNLESCVVWRRANALDQGYLYVVKDFGGGEFVLHENKDGKSGDIFNADDFEPYVAAPKKKEVDPVVKEIWVKAYLVAMGSAEYVYPETAADKLVEAYLKRFE